MPTVRSVIGFHHRLLAVLIAAALAVSACGSDDEANDYADQVNEIQSRLVGDVSETVSGGPPPDTEAAAEVAADLRDELVRAIRGVGIRIGRAEQAFADGTPEQAARAARELQSATADLQSELRTLIDAINAQLGD